EHAIPPWRAETFKFSTDPQRVAKVTDIVGLHLDSPRTRSCFRQPGHELPGLLAVTTHSRRREPRSRASHKRNWATIASTAASLAALPVLITVFHRVRLLSSLRREPPPENNPDVADQLNNPRRPAPWAMNRPVCATCRSRRRPDKDVLALRADQRMRKTETWPWAR